MGRERSERGRSPRSGGERLMRLALLFLRIGVQNEMQYRANFFIQLVQSAAVTGSGLVVLALVYSHTPDLNGWTHPQVIAVMGVFTMMLGIIGFVIEPNMARLNDDVRMGTLDLILTKPADAQLLVSVREFRLWSLTDVLVGVVVLAYGLVEIGRRISVAEWAGFAVTLMAGTIMIYCFWLLLTSGVFWFVRMEMVQEMFTGLSRAGQYPVGIYPGWLRFGLTYVAPLAFAITVPVEALTGRMTWVRLATTFGFLIVLATITRLVWRAGIRHYSGASA
jgi:ABC-2 type transport system permease protein